MMHIYALLGFLSLVHVTWLLDEATLIDDLKLLRAKQITVRQFIDLGVSCQLCRGHWITGAAFAPVYFTSQPYWLVSLSWSAVNGAHVLAVRWYVLAQQIGLAIMSLKQEEDPWTPEEVPEDVHWQEEPEVMSVEDMLTPEAPQPPTREGGA